MPSYLDFSLSDLLFHFVEHVMCGCGPAYEVAMVFLTCETPDKKTGISSINVLAFCQQHVFCDPH